MTELPFGWTPLIHTSSPEIARAAYSAIDGPVTLELPTRSDTPFSWQANQLRLNRLDLLASHYGSAIRATTSHSINFDLCLALTGSAHFRYGDKSQRLESGRAGAIISPGLPVTFDCAAGYTAAQLIFSEATVSAMLAEVLGSKRQAPLRFDGAIDFTTPAGAAVARLGHYIVDEAGHEFGLLRSPLVTRNVVEAMLHAILALPHNLYDAWRVPARPAAPKYLRRIEEYVEANAASSITLGDLAETSGMSVRSIQTAFHKYRGTTPTEFLRARRYDLARRRLISGSYKTVVRVALDSGFEHLGRFSARYRKLFGESPSETLRRHAL